MVWCAIIVSAINTGVNYRLHNQGSDLGEFSLDDLRRMRATGQLTGAEYVWREGMTDWATLDSILQEPTPTPRRVTPPPIPRSALQTGSSHAALWVVAGFVALIVVIMLGVFGAKIGARYLPFYRAGMSSREDSLAIAGKPIVIKSNTITAKEARRRAGEFRMRQWVEGYKQNGRRDEPCDAEAIQFLETWLGRSYSDDAATNLPSNSQWAEKLAGQSGCDDPLLLAAIADCTVSYRDKTNRLEQALNGFPNSKHKGYPKFYTAIMLTREVTDQARIKQWDGLAVGYFKALLSDGSVRPEDQAELGEIFINQWGYQFFHRNRDAICKITDDSGKPFHWLSLVLNGERHIIEAWQARGGGYANTVNSEGWRGFSSHLASARKSLTQAWKLRPDLPLAPERMIYVSLGDADIAEMRSWFDRTTAVQMDYAQAWSDFRWGLRPRWYGTLESMRALGLAALKTGRFDTDVPRKFFDAVSDMESEEGMQRGQHIYGQPDVWPHLKEMYEGYIAHPSQAQYRDGWRSAFFAVAYLAGKYDVARAQLEALHWKPLTNNLIGWGVDLSLAPNEVAARTGPADAQIASAEDAAAQGDIAKALSIYALLPALNLDERSAQFVRYRIALLDHEQRLQKGEWVDFLPASDDDPLWVVARGKMRRLADGGMEVQCEPTGHFIFCKTRIGAEFEIRGEFDVAKSSSENFQAGLVMGYTDLSGRNWYGFRMIRNARKSEFARLTRAWTQPDNNSSISLKDEANSFDVKFHQGKFTAVVNGKTVMENVDPPQEISAGDDSFYAGFGAYNSRASRGETVIVYRRVQIRKLTSENQADGAK